jgi:hypothetical protein
MNKEKPTLMGDIKNIIKNITKEPTEEELKTKIRTAKLKAELEEINIKRKESKMKRYSIGETKW